MGRRRHAAHIARPRVIVRACDSIAPGPHRRRCFPGADLLHPASAQSTTRHVPDTLSLARTPHSGGVSGAPPRLARSGSTDGFFARDYSSRLRTRRLRGVPDAAQFALRVFYCNVTMRGRNCVATSSVRALEDGTHAAYSCLTQAFLSFDASPLVRIPARIATTSCRFDADRTAPPTPAWRPAFWYFLRGAPNPLQ